MKIVYRRFAKSKVEKFPEFAYAVNGLNFRFHETALDWLNESLEADTYFLYDHHATCFFKKYEDALLFKMRFSDHDLRSE